MALSPLLRRLFLVIGACVPTLVFAHPGHDGDHGGGLTWDFVSDVLHRLSSPYHLAPALIVGVGALLVWRNVRAKRDDSTRR